MHTLAECYARPVWIVRSLSSWLMLCCLIFGPRCAQAQQKSLSKADQDRIDKLVQCILKTPLNDGSIPVIGYHLEGQPVYIDPYFVNLAMLGILAADQTKPNPKIHACVGHWLDWCVANQQADGTFKRYDGKLNATTRSIYEKKEIEPDSHDSYAAGFLAVVEAKHFRKQRENVAPQLLQACKQAFHVLERCKDPSNGFYWNFDPKKVPSGKVPTQYMLDNIEVHQGLKAAQVIFAESNENELAELAQNRVKELESSLHKFYHPQHEYFGCMYGDVELDLPWGKQEAKPERLATVSALGLLDQVPVDIREKLWKKLIETHSNAMNKSFAGKVFLEEDPTVERVFFAGVRCAPNVARAGLLNVVRKRTDEILKAERQLADPSQQARSFPYVQRYGMLIQALLLNANQQPTELPNVPVSF